MAAVIRVEAEAEARWISLKKVCLQPTKAQKKRQVAKKEKCPRVVVAAVILEAARAGAMNKV
ncbi:MAG: hypothetical protein ACXVBM_09250 [Flavisolibacter sp.]